MSRDRSCPHEKHGDMRDLVCSQGMCLLTILIAAKGSGVAQLSYQKCEMPKISTSIFDVSKGGGGSRQTERIIDVSCGQNRYARLPLVKFVSIQGASTTMSVVTTVTIKRALWKINNDLQHYLSCYFLIELVN